MAESKPPVTNMSSVGIIYRAANPSEVFIEMKDDGHPIKLVRRQLCFIGGNWIGEGAKNDGCPFGTFSRELGEELSFERPIRDSVDLNLLGMSDVEHFAPVPQEAVEVTVEDRDNLNCLKRIIVARATPFGVFLNTVSKAALDAADPENKREGFTSLVSYWEVPLQENAWKILAGLQKKFGNLSNESLTLITSLGDIIRTGTKTAFAHDRVLQRFFLRHGFPLAKDLPLVSGLESVRVPALSTYTDYLQKYEVAKKPI